MPQMETIDNIFRVVLMNGEKCEAGWIHDIINETFSDVTYMKFCYIIEIYCKDFKIRKSEVEEVLLESCRSLVKEFLFNLKDLAMTDFAARQQPGENVLMQSSITGRHSRVPNNDVIDLDEFPDEDDFECLCLLSKSEQKWEKLSLLDLQDLLLPYLKREGFLSKLWFCEKWLTANGDHLVVSEMTYDADDKDILNYKPKSGTAKVFWEIQRGKKKKPLNRKSEPLTRSKTSYLKELPLASIYKVPTRPFDYTIPKVDRSLPTLSFYGSKPEVATSSAFDELKGLNEWDEYIEAASNHHPVDPTPMDHDGIILSSDEDEPLLKNVSMFYVLSLRKCNSCLYFQTSKQPKKFFSDPDLAKRRVTLKSETVSKKPQFAPRSSRARKSSTTARVLLKAIDESSPEVPVESYKTRRNAPEEDMFIEIKRPTRMRDAKTEAAKLLAAKHRATPYIPTEERRSMDRGKRMLGLALDAIKNQDSANKRPSSSQNMVTAMVEIHDTPKKEDEGTFDRGPPQLTFFGRNLDVHGMRPRKPEINFDLMDYE